MSNCIPRKTNCQKQIDEVAHQKCPPMRLKRFKILMIPVMCRCQIVHDLPIWEPLWTEHSCAQTLPSASVVSLRLFASRGVAIFIQWTGVDVLRLGLTSGETSPSRTMFSMCTLSTNSRNLLRLMRPIGHRSALRRDVEV